MNDAPSAEAPRIGVGIRHIVAMRQKNSAQPAQSFEPVDELGYEARRIDQPVPARMPDEITVSAVGFRRIKAAVINDVFEKEGEIVQDRLSAAVLGADGSGRAGQKRLQGLSALGIRGG